MTPLDSWLPADIYVFNGDADGICGVHQLRLAFPSQARLVTGVKRDIGLLKQVQAERDQTVAVLDIAIEKNLPALRQLLEQGNHIHWFDHHKSDEIPKHPNFQAHINIDKTVNTSRLVDLFTEGFTPLWAIVGLFGDNIDSTADSLCQRHNLSDDQRNALRELGQLMNYNAYGESLADLHYTPMDLLAKVAPFTSPLDFIAQTDVLATLREGRQSDMALAWKGERIQPNIYRLPYEKWARRVVGEFGNELARSNPDSAFAVMVENGQGGYVVSVRSPMSQSISAAELCKQFDTGGGRTAAAGINLLPQEDVSRFVERFNEHYHLSHQGV